jgi:hypothetical protein
MLAKGVKKLRCWIECEAINFAGIISTIGGSHLVIKIIVPIISLYDVGLASNLAKRAITD